MVVIGERQSNGYIAARQQNYGPHFQSINARLRALGLRTYTPEEIRRQIAQAEIDAYFRNDPDAMLSASKRLGASFILRGLISSQATRNPMMAVNQVSVNMKFTLYGGGIANLLATRLSDLGAAVPFYGSQARSEDVPKIKAPLLIHYAALDERIDAGWPGWEAALKTNGVKYQMYMYPGTNHGFHNDTTPRYDEAAAKLAWSRTISFFKENLKT